MKKAHVISINLLCNRKFYEIINYDLPFYIHKTLSMGFPEEPMRLVVYSILILYFIIFCGNCFIDNHSGKIKKFSSNTTI